MPPKKKVETSGTFPFPEMMTPVTQSSVTSSTVSSSVPVKP